jgi:hypothetical protein
MAPTADAAAAVPPHWNVNLRVDDADATVERAAGFGGEVVAPVMDTPGFRHLSWPIRRGRVLDRSAARRSVGGRLVDSWGRRISFEAVPQNGVS